jgi:hypothetical protein
MLAKALLAINIQSIALWAASILILKPGALAAEPRSCKAAALRIV